MSADVYDLLKIAAEELIAQNTKLKSDLASAREDLEHINEHGTEEINAAVELRQKLATALVELAEARDIAKSLVDYARQCLAELEKWGTGSPRYEREMNEIRVEIARVNWEETK